MITLLTGPTASGKDYILKTKFLPKFKRIISDTTRPMRSGEVDGVDYNFISKLEFEVNLQNGIYVAPRRYETADGLWSYGAKRVNPMEAWVGIVDLQGAADYIAEYGANNIQIIRILAKEEVRKARYLARESSVNLSEFYRRFLADSEAFSVDKYQDLQEIYGRSIVTWKN